MIEVAILDDHVMVLDGLESMLEDDRVIRVSGMFGCIKDLLNFLKTSTPNVLLMDISLPDGNGIELCRSITKTYPAISIIGLSNYNDSGIIKSMIDNGAKGYLLKNTDKKELIKAINTVYCGATYLPEGLRDLFSKEGTIDPGRHIPRLTRQEKEILNLIVKEHTDHEIAVRLFISLKKIETCHKNLIRKLGVSNTTDLIKTTLEKGLLK